MQAETDSHLSHYQTPVRRIKLSLQVKNTCNSQNLNQHNICRALPQQVKNPTQIKGSTHMQVI